MRFTEIPFFLSEFPRLPKADLLLGSDATSLEAYEHFTKPHPRLKIIQNKRWGVALFPLPPSFEEYLKLVHDEVRAKRRKCERAGFYYQPFDAFDRAEDIMEIHLSMPVRQGRPMDADYVDPQRVRAFFERRRGLHGIFDKGGKLRAYAYAPIVGQTFHYQRLLGHETSLKTGVMYFLITEVVRVMMEKRGATGEPSWAMYDTFFGASRGLREFKMKFGFRAYKVNWLTCVRAPRTTEESQTFRHCEENL